MKIDSRLLKHVIASRIRSLIIVDVSIDIFAKLNSATSQEIEHIRDVLCVLHSSTSSEDFKVNQEIFGNDPQKEFKKVLDFWIHNYVDFVCIDINRILHRGAGSDANLAIQVYDAMNDMTVDDYFNASSDDLTALIQQHEQNFFSVNETIMNDMKTPSRQSDGTTSW